MQQPKGRQRWPLHLWKNELENRTTVLNLNNPHILGMKLKIETDKYASFLKFICLVQIIATFTIKIDR